MKKVLIMVMVLSMALSTVACASIPIPSGDTTKISLGNIGSLVVGTLQLVSGIIAIAVLMYVGIKFMLASPAEKANLKGMLVPYIVGAVLIFGAGQLVGIIGGIAGQVSGK